MEEQAQAEGALQDECDQFLSQAESTKTWIRKLLEPLSSSVRDVQTEELKHIAQVSEAELIFNVSKSYKTRDFDLFVLYRCFQNVSHCVTRPS